MSSSLNHNQPTNNGRLTRGSIVHLQQHRWVRKLNQVGISSQFLVRTGVSLVSPSSSSTSSLLHHHHTGSSTANSVMAGARARLDRWLFLSPRGNNNSRNRQERSSSMGAFGTGRAANDDMRARLLGGETGAFTSGVFASSVINSPAHVDLAKPGEERMGGGGPDAAAGVLVGV